MVSVFHRLLVVVGVVVYMPSDYHTYMALDYHTDMAAEEQPHTAS